MNAAAESRKNIKYITTVLRGLVALDEELEEAGSIEKLTGQKQAALDDLIKQEEVLNQRIAGLATEFEGRMSDATRRAAAIDEQSAAILAAAEAQRAAAQKETERVGAELQTSTAAASAAIEA